MGYHTAHLCATFDTNESLSPEIELRYEAIHQTKQSTVQQERNNNSWHPAAETNEFDPMRAESSTISIEARQMWSRRYCHRCDDQYLEVQRSSRARREDKRHDGPVSNKAEHLHAANTSKRRIRGVHSACTHLRQVRARHRWRRSPQRRRRNLDGRWRRFLYVNPDGRLSLQTETDSLARQTAGSYPKAGSALRGCEAFV